MDPRPGSGRVETLHVLLRRDEGGYPPFESEEVSGLPVGDHLFEHRRLRRYGAADGGADSLGATDADGDGAGDSDGAADPEAAGEPDGDAEGEPDGDALPDGDADAEADGDSDGIGSGVGDT